MVVEVRLEVVLMDRSDELLELLVGRQDDRGGGHLVEIPDLQAHDPVLDVVHDANAVAGADLTGPLEQLNEPKLLAVQRHRHTALETHGQVLGLVGRLLRAGDELEDVVAGRLLEVLDRPALG